MPAAAGMSDPQKMSGGMAAAPAGMADMGQMMGMMGGQKNGAGASTPSSLPGFPGAPHLYHVGADGFFLNHPQHIDLTAEQQSALGKLQETALLDRASAQRTIDEAEQQLFLLTGADQPDAAQIEAQVHSIEALRAQKRLAYIRAVGQAAQILSDDQRRALLAAHGWSGTSAN